MVASARMAAGTLPRFRPARASSCTQNDWTAMHKPLTSGRRTKAHGVHRARLARLRLEANISAGIMSGLWTDPGSLAGPSDPLSTARQRSSFRTYRHPSRLHSVIMSCNLWYCRYGYSNPGPISSIHQKRDQRLPPHRGHLLPRGELDVAAKPGREPGGLGVCPAHGHGHLGAAERPADVERDVLAVEAVQEALVGVNVQTAMCRVRRATSMAPVGGQHHLGRLVSGHRRRSGRRP